jgi:hypothetical protein
MSVNFAKQILKPASVTETKKDWSLAPEPSCTFDKNTYQDILGHWTFVAQAYTYTITLNQYLLRWVRCCSPVD